jgi:uncharacterized protein YjbI with pentapeptide repeats
MNSRDRQNSPETSDGPPDWYFKTVEDAGKNVTKLLLTLISISSYVTIAVLGIDDFALIDPSARFALPLLNVSVSTFTFLIGGQMFVLAVILYCYLGMDRLEMLILEHHDYWTRNTLRLETWSSAIRLLQKPKSFFHAITLASFSALVYILPFISLLAVTLLSIKTHREAFANTTVAFTIVGGLLVIYFSWRSQNRLEMKGAKFRFRAKRRVAFRLLLLSIMTSMLLILVYLAPSKNTHIFNIDLYGRSLVPKASSSADFHTPSIVFESDLPLQFAILFDAELPGIKITRGKLHGVYALGANLAGVNLVASDLTDGEFHGANLSNARLTLTTAKGARFSTANLHGADLAGASLQGTNFHGANLQGADLHGADLTGADLGTPPRNPAEVRTALIPTDTDSRANLKDATISIHTILPDGKNLSESAFPWKDRGMIVINREGYVLDPQPVQKGRSP